MKRGGVLAAIGAALVVAGCGGGGDGSNASRYSGEKAKAARVIDELEAASRAADGNRICKQLFTRNLAISVTKASKRQCATEVTSQLFADDADFKVEDIAVAGKQASLRVKDQEDRVSLLVLLKQRGRWRIGRIGPASGS